MMINDFSALIQLTATLSIAFVAVEYVRSYTSVLCEKIFKFHDFVRDSFEQCRSMLTDMDTLSHIQPIEIGGGITTNSEIEAAKRNNEALTKEIDIEEENKKKEVTIVCQAKSMSSMCFFVFLFNMLLLFIGGVENKHAAFVHVYVLQLCFLSIAYMIVGWCLGEKEKPARYCDFASLRHSIFGFIIIFVLASIGSLVFYFSLYYTEYSTLINSVYWYILIFSILFTYANFLVFVFKIRMKAKRFMSTVIDSKEKLESKCKKAEESVSDLMGTTRLISKLQAD